jgi:cyclin C
VATAVVYFRRFYAANNFAEHDPGVIAAGSLYLAGKVEEAVVGAKQLLNCIRSMGTTWGWPCELKQLLDAEMVSKGTWSLCNP